MVLDSVQDELQEAAAATGEALADGDNPVEV